MKKKFKITDASTGEKFKLSKGKMLVMNNQGIFFLIGVLRRELNMNPLTFLNINMK